jgi:hypothetical protein
MTLTRSNLAKQVAGRQTDIVERTPGGLCFHTTGSGITKKARARKLTPIIVALDVYHDMQRGSEGYDWGGPAYVMDTDGRLYQIAAEDTRTNHVGSIVEGHDRRDDYLSGRWRTMCSRAAVSCWEQAWPGYLSPQHLFGSRRANTYYIGCELIPCGDQFGSAWTSRSPSLRFSEAQHRACIALAVDVAVRWEWPENWWTTPRLVSHEDVGLLDRSDAGGGWDWGALRLDPYVDFPLIRTEAGAAWSSRPIFTDERSVR